MEPLDLKPFHVVETPQQLKAFTDPLRIRILVVLSERAATNQQLADALGEPQAKVLYHIRFLLDADLIRLVDTQVKGGNVEKYYRSIARTFDLRVDAALRPNVIGAEFAVISQEVAASAARWPDQAPRLVVRGRRVSPERAADFFNRLLEFITTYWDDPHGEEQRADPGPAADQDEPLFYCAAVVFRGARTTEEDRSRDPPDG